MSKVEASVDDNMNNNKNEGNGLNVEFTHKNADLEKGNRGLSSRGIPWSKVLIMVGALGVLVAACTVAWVFQNWQTSLLVLAIFLVVYLIAFYWRWLYVAAITAPRDFFVVKFLMKLTSRRNRLSELQRQQTLRLHNAIRDVTDPFNEPHFKLTYRLTPEVAKCLIEEWQPYYPHSLSPYQNASVRP